MISLNVLFGGGNGGNETRDEVRVEVWVWTWVATGKVTAGPMYSQLMSIESGVSAMSAVA